MHPWTGTWSNPSTQKAEPRMSNCCVLQCPGGPVQGMRMDTIIRSSLHNVSPSEQRAGPVALNSPLLSALSERLRLAGEDHEALSRQAVKCVHLAVSGVLFKPRSQATGDSNVMFIHPSLGGPCPGRITDIFVHKRDVGARVVEETFLAVRRWLPLAEEEIPLDPFRKYRVGGALYYDEFADEPLVLRAADLICHVGRTVMEDFRFKRNVAAGEPVLVEPRKPCIHIRPLDRVGSSQCRVKCGARIHCLYSCFISPKRSQPSMNNILTCSEALQGTCAALGGIMHSSRCVGGRVSMPGLKETHSARRHDHQNYDLKYLAKNS